MQKEFESDSCYVVSAMQQIAYFFSAAEDSPEEVELISGRQEAELFLGATHSVEIGGPYLVFDLGGDRLSFLWRKNV